MKTLLPFVLLSLFLLSCNKEEIKDPPIGNDPIFKASGSIGNNSFQITAGDDGYTMETGIDLNNGIQQFFGSLNNGENQFKIVIKDGHMSESLIDAIHSSIDFSFYPNTYQLTLSKSEMPNSYLIQSIEWYIDGDFAGLNELTFDETGIFDVCANVLFTDGSEASICNELILGYQSGSHFQLRHFLSSDGELKVWIDENNEEVDHVDWYIDDQWVGSDLELYTDIISGGHKLRAEVDFENGTHRTRSIWIDGTLQGKYIDDFASIEHNWQGPYEDFSAQLFLKWENKNYISVHNEQSEDYFIIEDIASYGLNEFGNPIIKIHGIVHCEMQNVETGEIIPFECETDFALQLEQ